MNNRSIFKKAAPLAAVLAVAIASLFVRETNAQSLTASAGYSVEELFNVGSGKTISAMGSASNGDIYYLENTSTSTALYLRTAASNYAAPSEALFTFGSMVFGSFVRVESGTVYFAENSVGGIYSIPVGGGTTTPITTLSGNFDLKFSGGVAFVSANQGGFNAENAVYKLDLSSGALDTIIGDTGDYSGPITFDGEGNLYYGATAFGGAGGDIYRITAAQIQSVIDADPDTNDTYLDLGDAENVYDNDNNQYFGGNLYVADSPFGSAGTIKRYDTAGDTMQNVAATGDGHFFGGIDAQGETVYAAVNAEFGSGPAAVYKVVPEPGVAVMLLCGVGLLKFRRRR